MLPCTQKLSELKFTPKGIILSGGPYSVYEEGSPHVDPAVFDLNGMQELAYRLNPENVIAGTHREYGHAMLKARSVGGHVDRLFDGIEDSMRVWMSHGDKLAKLPEGFHTVATSDNSEYAAIGHESKPIYGLQFHPEVTHTQNGTELLKNFAVGICGCKQDWTMQKFLEEAIAQIRHTVGETGQVLAAVSDGVMRLNECEQVNKDLSEALGINLTVVDATDRFLEGLKGIEDPEKKRKFIGGKFIDIFEEEAVKIEDAAAHDPTKAGKIEFFMQYVGLGTLYPDVIESLSFKGPSATIKTHHNVGGLPARMANGQGLKLIEPLRSLYKDEVRAGIAVRILGEVTAEKVDIARKADHIFISEIRKAGLYDQISQAYAAVDPSRAVGVMGDKRVYGYIIILRAVTTTDYMTAEAFNFPWDFLQRVMNRIVNEVHGVCRVVYDVTSKPPGTIEME
ncbi:GMP synthase (glutamine-hydrolyzing) [Staphylotrichum longicolle]|uniref:GMP synthase (glutamine-hydrolyzing) n=1 Tax=Staphylotrichum longicolle TaxID=669026 RepID=A0AAD4HYG8_9PEZI|nr:GMP synthase (glutamine-hydrolyzing) [Staphylotrichum longicolle]